MTASSTAPDYRPITGYNDPPDNIFGNMKGKARARDFDDLEDEESTGSSIPEGSQQEQDTLNGRHAPRQPRSRRMNNTWLSSMNRLRADSRASSNREYNDVADSSVAATASHTMHTKTRYPAHSAIPTEPTKRPPTSMGHLSERFDEEVHALEHEIQDTLFRGSEVDRRIHDLTLEESRESQMKYHMEDPSMDMDVSIDEKTLRTLRRSRYLRSAAVTGIFVLLW